MSGGNPNFLDRALASLFPVYGLRRYNARALLTGYEAADPGRLRKQRKDAGSGDRLAKMSAVALRSEVRHLDRNHDIARGTITTLVNNTVGAEGIQVEAEPQTVDGEIHQDLADALQRYWKEYCRRPEVTGEWDFGQCQRRMARTWVRDGEGLSQLLEGNVPLLDHGTVVPFSLELMEPDLLPFDLYDDAKGIAQGIERNGWGRRRAYHVLKDHPGDGVYLSYHSATRRIPAERMLHPRWTDRIPQLRGITPLASVITRLADVKDYEESERIAAKVAASMAAVIVKGTPQLYDARSDGEQRQLKFRPGMIFDDLKPGESVETIDSKRPNPNVETYRSGQLRAAAAGAGVSYSSMSRNYDGSYSSQRQELVEQWVHYAVLQREFTAQFVRPVWDRFVVLAVLSGAVTVPKNVDLLTLTAATYVGPQMPWIDPLKESFSNTNLERSGHKSPQQTIRERGGNPRIVLQQIGRWRKEADALGLVFDTDPAKTAKSGTAQDYLRDKTGDE